MPNRSKKPRPSGVVVPLSKRRDNKKDPREVAFDAAFGQRLKDARKQTKYTQQTMAAALGIGYDQYKKYENGSRSFPLYLLRDIAHRLDQPISWLLMG
jgi:DNA-binding XRE family transcriptional regulator